MIGQSIPTTTTAAWRHFFEDTRFICLQRVSGAHHHAAAANQQQLGCRELEACGYTIFVSNAFQIACVSPESYKQRIRRGQRDGTGVPFRHGDPSYYY